MYIEYQKLLVMGPSLGKAGARLFSEGPPGIDPSSVIAKTHANFLWIKYIYLDGNFVLRIKTQNPNAFLNYYFYQEKKLK